MLQQLSHFMTVLGLGVQVGTIVYFSFVLTPTLFTQLTREEAGRAVRLSFPGYYMTGVGALAVALCGALAAGHGAWVLLLVAAAAGAELYAWQIVLPRAHTARASILRPEEEDPNDPAQSTWKRLHRLSVQLNLAALGLGLAA